MNHRESTEKGRLRFRADGTFRILQLTDAHFGDMGPEDHLTRDLIGRLLDAEKPDLVVFTGDTAYSGDNVEALVWGLQPVVDAGLPWAMVFGNHDDECGAGKAELLAAQQSLPGCLTQAGEDGLFGLGNFVLDVHGASIGPASAGEAVRQHDDAAACAWRLLFLDSGANNANAAVGGYDFVKRDQIDWCVRMLDAGAGHSSAGSSVSPVPEESAAPPAAPPAALPAPGSSAALPAPGSSAALPAPGSSAAQPVPGSSAVLPAPGSAASLGMAPSAAASATPSTPAPCAQALVFLHIPVPEYDEVWAAGHCTGTKLEEVCRPRQNSGLFSALLETGAVRGVFAGHDHLNDFCGALHGIALCYGRATGWRTYGDDAFPHGGRIILLEEGKRGFKTWCRLADGSATPAVEFA